MLEFYPTLLKSGHYINTYYCINNFCMLASVSHVIMFTGMQDYKICISSHNLTWEELIRKLMKNYAPFAIILVALHTL